MQVRIICLLICVANRDSNYLFLSFCIQRPNYGFSISRADFTKEPALHWLSKLSSEVKVAIKNSKVLFINGYGFDELSPGALLSAMEYAVEVGTSIFFDPGPRGKSLYTGTPDEQRALNQLLRMSDVLLLTSDEVSSKSLLVLHLSLIVIMITCSCLL